jgi:UDP-GlcNAc:undecaprenyl-phosphate GlcNAc-1-phosphate transferase
MGIKEVAKAEPCPASMSNYKTYWVILILSGVATLVLTPLVIHLARRFGALDQPGARKVHRQPMPLLGGLAVAAGMWLPIAALCFYDNRVSKILLERWELIIPVLCSSLVMLGLGVIDDLRGLNARIKFMVQLPVALVLVMSGLRFENLTLPGLGAITLAGLGPVITVAWIVGITNAVNLVDGIDGLAAGVALFAAAASALIAIMNDNVLGAVLMTAMAGACLGFLPFNFNPARIFLGDTGSLFLGMTLAVSSIVTQQKGALAASLLIPVLVLGFPIVDTLLAMARRVVRGKSMFSGDAGHIHHRLLAKGMSHRQAALTIYIICILCGLVALLTVMQNNLGMAIGFAGMFFVLYVALRSLGYVKTLLSLINSPDRLKFKLLYHCTETAKCRLGLAENREQVLRALEELCLDFGKPGFTLQVAAMNGSPAFEHRWRGPSKQADTALLARESFEFANTGLKLEFHLEPLDDNDELHLEKRNQLGGIAEAVNNRMAALMAVQG